MPSISHIRAPQLVILKVPYNTAFIFIIRKIILLCYHAPLSEREVDFLSCFHAGLANFLNHIHCYSPTWHFFSDKEIGKNSTDFTVTAPKLYQLHLFQTETNGVNNTRSTSSTKAAKLCMTQPQSTQYLNLGKKFFHVHNFTTLGGYWRRNLKSCMQLPRLKG